MPMSRSFGFTCGLWMISPTRKSAAVGKFAAGLVGVVHRAVHAVAEAEFPGQAEAQRPHVEPVAGGRAGASTTELW